MLRNTDKRYGSVSKFFHWVMALLIIGMLFLGYYMVGDLVTVHQFIGLSIFTLATFRLIWILSNPHPRLPPTISRFDYFAARTVEALLYVCMFFMPLSGWAMSTALGIVPSVGAINIPMPWIPLDDNLGGFFLKIHNTLAIAIIVLVVFHVSGALKHYFFDKDDVLQNMLPGSKVEE